MEISLSNLTNEGVSKYQALVIKIIGQDFPELESKYETVKVVLFRPDSSPLERVKKEVEDFMGGTCVTLSDAFSLKTTAKPPKACVQINLTVFDEYPSWKQAFALRHECGHMLLKGEEPKTLTQLISKYGIDKVKNFVRYIDEFEVHNLVITKWENDWLKESVGFGESMPVPSLLALDIRKAKGKEEAMLFCINNIVHLLTLLKLYDNISNNNKGLVKTKKQSAKRYLKSFSYALNVDSKNFPEPRYWFKEGEFFSQELYFQKIEKLLGILEKA